MRPKTMPISTADELPVISGLELVDAYLWLHGNLGLGKPKKKKAAR